MANIDRQLGIRDKQQGILRQAINTIGHRALAIKGHGNDAHGVPHDLGADTLPHLESGIFLTNKDAVEICLQAGLDPKSVAQRFVEHNLEQLGDSGMRRRLMDILNSGIKTVYVESHHSLPISQSIKPRRN